MPAPPFGTASAYTDSFPAPPPKEVTIAAETCFNLGIFKDMVKQYRKFDDQVITRLNRASAQLRDQSRTSRSGGPSEGQEAMCTKMWSEMMAGWAHRQTMLTFCLQTVTASMESKKSGIVEQRLAASSPGTDDGRRHRGVREEEVIAEQLANEESIEAIIRKRTLDAFKSRCPFFTPRGSSTVGQEWWDLADSGRRGKGPDLA